MREELEQHRTDYRVRHRSSARKARAGIYMGKEEEGS